MRSGFPSSFFVSLSFILRWVLLFNYITLLLSLWKHAIWFSFFFFCVSFFHPEMGFVFLCFSTHYPYCRSATAVYSDITRNRYSKLGLLNGSLCQHDLIIL